MYFNNLYYIRRVFNKFQDQLAMILHPPEKMIIVIIRFRIVREIIQKHDNASRLRRTYLIRDLPNRKLRAHTPIGK